MNYEEINKKIRNLIDEICKLQASQDNSKYVNACYNTMLSDLNDMISFFHAQIFKDNEDKDPCIICGNTEDVEQDQGFYYCKEHMKDALL